MVKIKRAYDEPLKDDGKRVLVDRVWPRGVSKEKARIDLWLKDVAPSTALRKWFAHDPEKFSEFRKRYREELKKNKKALQTLKREAKSGTLTLVYGAKDEEHNQPIVLKELLAK